VSEEQEREHTPQQEPKPAAPPLMHRWVGIVGLFIAPTTVITSLCYYFGYFSTRKYFDYFGIDSNAIGFTTSDYVLRSVRSLYLPIIVLLLAWLAALWAGQYVRLVAKAGRRTGLVRAVAWTALAIGVVGIARAILGMTAPQLKPDHITALTPVGLGLGSASLIVGFWLLAALQTPSTPRTFATTKRVSLLVAAAAIVLALFWLANIYATFRGEDDAKVTARELWSRETSVVLDTTQRLGAPSDLIFESKLPSEDQAKEPTQYRYECFRALVVRGDLWVLVPAGWTNEHGYAVIVAAGPANRIALIKLLGIAKKPAANRNGGWQCPEVGPV
jgi:hypothetical protein